MARRRRGFAPEVNSAITNAAQRFGLPIEWMQAFARAESGGNPRAQTGSYAGLFQLSPSEFQRAGGTGSIYDPHQNAMAAGQLLAAHRQAYIQRYGSEPGANDLYMIHQQGWGGYQAHRDNPGRLAWQSMASTREGLQKDARGPVYRLPDGSMGLWSQAAIARNLTRGQDWRTTTSGQFQQGWQERLVSLGVPAPAPDTMIAAADPNALAPAYDPNPPGSRPGDRDLSALSAAELTRMAGPRTSPFEEFTGITPNINEIADSIPAPVVPSTQPTQMEIGNIFGQRSIPGAKNIGAALSAAGQAIANAGPRIPQMEDPARQLAALGPEGQWPTIPVRRRRPFGPTSQGPA